jgi:catechol 2,3-dioxygenase-like lactoylglutathione lyase family enzyme
MRDCGIEWQRRRIAMVKLARIAPELPVAELQTSLDYYRQKLGFDVAMQMPDYAIVERDDIAIHLFQASGHNVPVAIHIFTQDLETLEAELQSRGARIAQKIARKPWGNRDFRVIDDSGNVIKFTEPLAEA